MCVCDVQRGPDDIPVRVLTDILCGKFEDYEEVTATVAFVADMTVEHKSIKPSSQGFVLNVGTQRDISYNNESSASEDHSDDSEWFDSSLPST